MKRNTRLYLLSHDHHHGLVEANRLANLSDDINELSLIQIKTNFIKFYNEELSKHFREEEEILLPVYAKFTSESNAEILEVLKQHKYIREKILEIEKTPEKEVNISQLKQLGKILKEHIRFEERQVFPSIENSVPELYLKQIEERLRSY